MSDPAGGFPQVPPPPRQPSPPPLVPAVPGPASAPLGGQLHPAVIAVWSAGQIGALVFVLLVNPLSMVALAPFLVLILGVSAVRYARFRWQLTEGTLVIEQGLINRQRRVIPIERVQSVDLIRRITHRLFGVVAVQVEAIGSGDTEGRLDALAPAVAERLRQALLAGRTGGTPAQTPAEAPAGVGDEGTLLVQVAPRQLVVAGVTEANVTLIAAVTGVIWQLLGDRADELAQRLPRLIGTRGALVVAVGIVLAAVVLLILAQVVTYWDFRLRRTGTELRVRRGLTEQRYDTIPLHRLQALRIEENLPRRLLGLASVRADVAGKPGGGSGGTDTLLPIGSADAARRLVSDVLDAPGLGDVSLEAMPRRALARRRFRALAAVALLTVAAVVVWDVVGLVALALVVPALAAAEASYRALGHVEAEDYLVVRAGWWVRRTAFVPTDRLQSLELSASLFQRWRDLATLDLQIARSPGLWSGPQMIDLDARLGRHLVRWLAELVHTRPSVLDRDVAPSG